MNFKWLTDYNLITLESTDSTNTEGLKLARCNIKDNHVIVAENQFAGRGSSGKSWISMPGNLNCSILLVDVPEIRYCTIFPFLMANVLYKTINYFNQMSNAEIEIQLKWPNDILINDKKVAGILVETITINNINYLVIGFGINVILNPVIENSPFASTSLANEGLYIEDKQELFNMIIENFNYEYKIWNLTKSFTAIKHEWLKHAYHLNECITITDGQKQISGIFKDINSLGEIIMELSNGQLITYTHGDVI